VRTEKFFASTAVRLSFIYSVLLTVSFLLAITLTWVAARSAAESDLRDRITLEVEALVAEIRDEGLDAAVAAIAARAERPGALEYWMVGPDGHILSGDLPSMAGADGWHRVDLPDVVTGAEAREELLVLTAAMPDGSRLSVGDDLRRAESVRDAVLQSLLWIGLATVVLGILAGVFLTRKSLQQMDALSSIVDEVAVGNLAARLLLRATTKPNDLDRLAESVNRMLDQIDKLVRNLRRVSSDVAHDLRTPLSHVQQRLELANTAASADDRLAAIESAQSRISDVLQSFDAILRLAEIEAGAAKSRFVDVDVAALVDRVADAYRPDVDASGLSLQIGHIDRVSIHGDDALLAQALANLIENAIRHAADASRITLSTAIDGASLQLMVADNGRGISPHLRGDVIQPFLRLESSRSTAGFGLGLSIVAAIAQLHNASLELSDECPGLGVTLKFANHRPIAVG